MCWKPAYCYFYHITILKRVWHLGEIILHHPVIRLVLLEVLAIIANTGNNINMSSEQVGHYIFQ